MPDERHPQAVTPPVQTTIVSKLKKFFGGSNKPQTVATEIPAQGGNSGYTVNKTRILDGVTMTFEKKEASLPFGNLEGVQYAIEASTETTEENYNLFSNVLDQPAYTVMIDGSPVDDLNVGVDSNGGYMLGVFTKPFGNAVSEYDHYIGSHIVDIDLLSVTVSPEFMLAVRASSGKSSTPIGGK